MDSTKFSRRAKLKALHLALAPFLALNASSAMATIVVQNCDDSGVGSLRQAVANAIDGDTIDASQLTPSSPGCSASTITLRTGAIVIGVDNLEIDGPGSSALTISGKYNGVAEPDRIFLHNGSNNLQIRGFEIMGGRVSSDAGSAYGGCIYSKGFVDLEDTVLTDCRVSTVTGVAAGGGIYASVVEVEDSRIKYNTAYASGTGVARGGGAASYRNFILLVRASVDHNSASSNSGVAYGGGLYSRGHNLLVDSSTVSNNTSSFNDGGISMKPYNLPVAGFYMTNSTISSNTAQNMTGGMYLTGSSIVIKGSTIALNSSQNANLLHAPGVAVNASNQTYVSNTIVADNTYGSTGKEYDISNRGVTLQGSNNLVRVTSIDVPSDTISGKCPMLGPLQSNGGMTQTHRLKSGSPAIDAGTVLENEPVYDQRGSPNLRSSSAPGEISIPDIGAYEVQQDDELYNADFETCI